MSGSAKHRLVRFGGVAVRVADDQPTFWDRVEAGRWEPGTLAALDGLLGPDVLFLDLGAWVGPLTLLAAASGARVVAVEADPAALDQLGRNRSANPALADRITVVAKAITPRPGSAVLGARRKPGDSMSSTLLAESAVTWTADGVTPAELAPTLPDASRLLIKLDLEGAEYDLLPALAPLLAGRDPVVLVSFHPVILADAGELDPAARQRNAVTAAFPGWSAFAVTDHGPAPRGRVPDAHVGAVHDAPQAEVVGGFRPEPGDGDTWLFRPG